MNHRVPDAARLWYHGGEVNGMDTKATGRLIAARRKERGLSQLELATQLHVTDKAVSRWETGRGMPALETLEPLGEVLGLTVSELLAGRELTEAELPAAAGKQILEGMRKARKQLWCGAAVMLAAMGLAAGLFFGWHYVTSVEVTDVAAADRTALTRQAERYLSRLNRESRGAGGTLSMVDLEQRGNYLAALCVEEDGGWDLCIYDRDAVFKNRWKANGGAFGMECGTVNSWNFGSPQREAVIVFGGWGLPQDIRAYSFEHDGITYIAPAGDGGKLLDLFVVPDSRTIAPANLALLAESGRRLPYPNPWQPERNA